MGFSEQWAFRGRDSLRGDILFLNSHLALVADLWNDADRYSCYEDVGTFSLCCLGQDGEHIMRSPQRLDFVEQHPANQNLKEHGNWKRWISQKLFAK